MPTTYQESDLGPFGLCTGYWDEKNQMYQHADITEMAKCCLNTCSPTIEQCRKDCLTIKNPTYKYLCYDSCDRDIQNSCVNNCILINNIYGTPIMKNVLKDFGCGDGIYKQVDKDCATKNKDAIIKQCTSDCIPTRNIDCSKYCNFSYDYLVDPDNHILGTKSNMAYNVAAYGVVPKENQLLQKTSSSIMYVWIGVGISLIIIFVIYFLI